MLGTSFGALVCDIDGVILHDDSALPGAVDLVAWLKARSLPFVMLTNFPSQTAEDLKRRFQKAGLAVAEEHFYTSAMATAEFLQNQAGEGRRVFVVGEGALVHALYGAGFTLAETEVDFVVVGETRAYNFDMIQRAAQLINDGARFIATNPDVAGPRGRPSCGAFCAPIERITRKFPFYVGKPSAFMMRAALKHLKSRTDETWLAGDNMDTDIIAGVQAGLVTALVLTGVSREEDLPRYPYRPSYVLKDAAALLTLLRGHAEADRGALVQSREEAKKP
jgi:NagD protein